MTPPEQRPEGSEGQATRLAVHGEGSSALRTCWVQLEGPAGPGPEGLGDHGEDLGLPAKPAESCSQDPEIHLQQDPPGERVGDEGGRSREE